MHVYIVTGIVLVWIFCGILAAGAWVAEKASWHRAISRPDTGEFLAWVAEKASWHRAFDFRYSLALGLGFGLFFSPIAALVLFFTTGFFMYGWAITPAQAGKIVNAAWEQ
jgi:hypothetical protein